MPTCTRATPTAVVVNDKDHDNQPCLLVKVTWVPVDGDLDRRDGTGYSFRLHHGTLAARMARAVNAGVAITFDGIGTDIYGKSYVVSRSHVLGRTANADLRRLGF